MREPEIGSVVVTVDDYKMKDCWKYLWQGEDKPPVFANRGGQTLTWENMLNYANMIFISAPGTQYKRISNSWQVFVLQSNLEKIQS